jgi:hypothetical protein
MYQKMKARDLTEDIKGVERMKRNMRFLLLFSILMSSIFAAYFISGCGDDSTIIQGDPGGDNDTVVGTISGIVTDAADGSLLVTCKVVWTHAGGSDSAYTDGNGYFTTGQTLSSGDYVLTFFPNAGSHAAASFTATIHTVGWHQTTTPNAHGVIPEEVDLNPTLWPMTGALTGYVFTALPMGVAGKDAGVLALDQPNLATVAAGVTVTVDMGAFDIIGDTYTTTTDANGMYTFTAVAACENATPLWVVLKTAQFTADGVDYGATSYSGADGNVITMGSTVPGIFAPLAGSPQRDLDPAPVVISYGWDGTTLGVTEDMVMVFSTAMDQVRTTVTFGGGLPITSSWSVDAMTLTVNPEDVLATGTNYGLVVEGESVSGLTLVDTDGSLNFERTVTTEVGIMLQSTNFGTIGEKTDDSTYENVALASDLVLTFNMAVDPTHVANVITFTVGATPVDYTATYNDAVVTITPTYELVTAQTYELTFTFYSEIENDATSSAWEYQLLTFDNSVTPAVPADFAMDTTQMTWPVDFNTTDVYLEWAIQADADSFYIYADAPYTALGRQIVAKTGSQQWGIKQGATVTLPVDFDVYDDAQQTPFAGGNAVSFWVRAKNNAGLSVYTDSILFSDQQGPENFLAAQWGNGDNTPGATEDTVLFMVGTAGSPIEYLDLNSASFDFNEFGGDPSYAFGGTVTWVDDNSLTYGVGTMYVPAASCAAGDWVVVSVTDNSGNTGSDSMLVLPWFEYVNPNPDSADGQFEAGDADVVFVSHGARLLDGSALIDIADVDILLTLDGSDFVDTMLNVVIGDSGLVNTVAFTVDDTLMVANTAQFTIANADGAGAANWSAAFSVAGIKLAGPDSVSYYSVTDTIIDRENTDSTAIPVSWDQIGLDSVVIWYSTNAGGLWNRFDTVDAALVSYDFYPPNVAGVGGYECRVKVTDFDADDRPEDPTTWDFHVFHDSVTFTGPANAGEFAGGSNTNIQWTNGVTAINDSLPSTFTIEYATDADGADTTWTSLSADVANDGIFMWTDVPVDAPAITSQLRFTDGGGNEYRSPLFTVAGIILTAPVGGENWETGTAHNITWDNVGTVVTPIDLEYSNDNGATWVATEISDDEDNSGASDTYSWTLPYDANGTALVRITSDDSLIVYDNSDSVFAMAGYSITYPTATDTLIFGRTDSVVWTTYGASGLSGAVTIKWLNGATLDTIVTGYVDAGSYAFAVPDIGEGVYPDTVRFIVENAGGTAADTTVDVPADEPRIAVNTPIATDTLQQSVGSIDITWDAIGLLSTDVIITVYDAVGPDDFTPVVVDTVLATSGTYNWSVPNLGLAADCNTVRVRIEEPAGGGAVTGISVAFVIKD